MQHSYFSPFDQAATAPIMHMRSKKHLSSCSNSTMSTISLSSVCSSMSPSSDFSVNSVDGGDSICSSSQSQQEEHFGSEVSNSSDCGWALQEELHHQPTSILTQEQIDLAILRERHSDIQQINSSMKQINEIQKSLALMVDAQSEQVDQLENDTMQSLEHASEGVSQIIALQQQNQSRRSPKAASLPNKKKLVKKTPSPSSVDTNCRVFFRNPWGLGYLSPSYL